MKIGFFDSGIGGLTVLKKVVRNFNNHKFYYFGDTLNVPYGSKPEYFLVNMLENIFDFFEKMEVDILISACNTTDSLVKKGITSVEKRSFRYISIIDNGIEQINEKEKVLLLATSNTVKSGSYRELLLNKAKVSKINEKACPLFVPLIEEGYWYGPMADSIINYYLRDCEGQYDKVILGCTHYPYLIPVIKKILGDNVKLINPAKTMAEKAKNILAVRGMISGKHEQPVEFNEHEFYVSDLNKLSHDFLDRGTDFLGLPHLSFDELNIFK